jgi:transcriptional regulator GlxA family with amidase domain
MDTGIARKRKLVVIVAPPDVQLMHAAGPCDVFSYTSNLLRQQPGYEDGAYEVLLASVNTDLNVVSNSGMAIRCNLPVQEIHSPIDTLIIAGAASVAGMENLGTEFYTWLNAIYPYVRRVAAICTGAFVLAKAGLLNEKAATTHYEFCPALKAGYPKVRVETNPFFVNDGKVYTSGGVSSGINMSLSFIEQDFGRETALKVARKLVLELKRPGNQAQFSSFLPALELKSALIKTLRPWLMQRISQPVKVEDLAQQVNMSPRNFARVFLNDTGLTPAKFMEKLRVESARRYLEDSDLSLEHIAELCGLGGMVSMRRVFLRHLEISPSYYRNSFKTSLSQELEN